MWALTPWSTRQKQQPFQHREAYNLAPAVVNPCAMHPVAAFCVMRVCVCPVCPPTCRTCVSDSPQCSSCHSHHFLHKGECLPDCPRGYYGNKDFRCQGAFLLTFFPCSSSCFRIAFGLVFRRHLFVCLLIYLIFKRRSCPMLKTEKAHKVAMRSTVAIPCNNT